ncbi:acyltransferase [Leuconostoc mesenteroides]|nr:acyltransferase [Leuconostoc mesenteroides]MBZ1523421.1 acyltransferase [Leuconostoc mesenteroides]
MILVNRVFNYFKNKIRRIVLFVRYNRNLTLGERVYWRTGFSVIIEGSGQLSIGNNCLFNFNCSIACLGQISIGDSNIFGESVKIYDHNHKFNRRDKIISEQGMSVGEVTIGNNCWFGSNVVILKGAKIGDNCVIGAGAIISGIIPDNSLLRTTHNYEVEKISFQN